MKASASRHRSPDVRVSSPRAPTPAGTLCRRSAPRVSRDAAVAPVGRQRDPAQEPEPDLLPDQRRRTRGGPCGLGHGLPRRATTGSCRTTATARCAWRSASRRSTCCCRPSAPRTTRPATAVRCRRTGAAAHSTSSRAAARPARSACRPSASPRPACSTSISTRSPIATSTSRPTRSSSARSATAPPAKASSGSRSTPPRRSGCPSSTWSKTTATRSRCRSRRRRPAATSRAWSSGSRI